MNITCCFNITVWGFLLLRDFIFVFVFYFPLMKEYIGAEVLP